MRSSWLRVLCCVGELLPLVCHASGETRWSPSLADVPELQHRIEMAAQNASQVIDRDSGRPFFGAALMDPVIHFYHVDHFDVPHLTGRVLDSLLMSEAVAGTTVSAEVISAYRTLIFGSFDGSDHLNAFQENGGARKVILHNLREGLSGLTALIKGRNDETARRLASAMVKQVAALMHEDGSWNYEKIRATPGVLLPGEYASHDAFYTSTAGRFLGALVKYYEATDDPEALALAKRIAEKAWDTCFTPEGKYTQAAGWHVHSITSTINSLAQLAETTGDAELLDRAERAYAGAFGGIITRFGWSRENLTNDLDTGEVNNTGDIIQTALILARNRRPEYYADIERMLRSHLLPSQLLDVSWVKESGNSQADAHREVANRTFGAFGFPAPYGHKIDRVNHVNFNFDITCGTAQSLCEVLRNACVNRGDGALQINVLFDMQAPGLRMVSHLPGTGRIELQTSGSKAIYLRIPTGVTPDQVQITADDRDSTATVHDGFLRLNAGPRAFSITYPLPETMTEEKLPGRTAQIWWRGEQVVRMKTSGTLLPFF